MRNISLILGLVTLFAISLTVFLGIKEKPPAFKEVIIGDQVWMAENLNIDTFNNGDPIPQAITKEEWVKAGDERKPAWCYKENDPANGEKYGKLYNWYAVTDPRGIAPEGWHVPSDTEWSQLIEFVGGKKGGVKMKSQNGWVDSSNGTNETGFTGLPAGNRNSSGDFSIKIANWWSSTEDSDTNASYTSLGVYSSDAHIFRWKKAEGMSVRLLRD